MLYCKDFHLDNEFNFDMLFANKQFHKSHKNIKDVISLYLLEKSKRETSIELTNESIFTSRLDDLIKCNKTDETNCKIYNKYIYYTIDMLLLVKFNKSLDNLEMNKFQSRDIMKAISDKSILSLS